MLRKLVEVAFELTHKCNLRCTHCYNQNNIRSYKEEMTTKQGFKALKDLRDFKVAKLKIGGGEPLLRKDFFDIYDYASFLGFEVNFSSNGILILENIEKIIDKNIKKLQISLDNIGEKHDTIRNYKGLFKIVAESVKELRKNNIKINIATTLTKANHKDLEQILEFCRENKVYRWKIIKYIPKDRNDKLLLSKKEYKHAVLLLSNYKKEGDISPEIIVAREFDFIKIPLDYNDMQCFGGKSFLSLKPNGNITPCSYMNNIICGNITTERIEKIWNSKKMIEFSKDYYDSGCAYAEKCKGGCKASSYFMNKTFACDPYCWVKK